MMLCHCLAVSSRAVRKAVDEGAVDLDEVLRRCGAGSVCGGCVPAVADELDQLCETGVAIRAARGAQLQGAA